MLGFVASRTKEQKKDERIEQLNGQVGDLVNELKCKDFEIKKLEEKLEIRKLLLDTERDGFKMATDVADQYLAKIADLAFEDLITKCQDAAFELDATFVDSGLTIDLDDVISAIYAVKENYFKKH